MNNGNKENQLNNKEISDLLLFFQNLHLKTQKKQIEKQFIIQNEENSFQDEKIQNEELLENLSLLEKNYFETRTKEKFSEELSTYLLKYLGLKNQNEQEIKKQKKNLKQEKNQVQKLDEKIIMLEKDLIKIQDRNQQILLKTFQTIQENKKLYQEIVKKKQKKNQFGKNEMIPDNFLSQENKEEREKEKQEIEKLKAYRNGLENIFKNLIIESGIDWSKIPSLKKIILNKKN
ncbi:hypothetical protein M0811_04903 [Anaeramoeba ignava]|uniref:Centromere protein H C-terminal domain-containing protein n=1 Tax=Anaeramoeba ignava TaxID=1746090 RepID=A0A9Q0LW83_ANAIG|nr:hypothetical protein M0811_04903 [Anaeramoeba ignava]